MNKNTEKLLQLIKDNPETEVLFMTNFELCLDDACQYWMGRISSVEKTIYWHGDDEHVYIGESEIKDEMECQEIDEEEYAIMLKDGKIKEAIIAYIDA